MSLFEDAMAVAVKLPLDQRERLAQALGLKLAPRATLPMANASAGPMANASAGASVDPAQWRARERGHAVLDLADTNLKPGPGAIAGMWADLDLETGPLDDAPTSSTIGSLPRGTPVVVHASVVIALALDLPFARTFWENPPVEPRLATATYLGLLEMCATDDEQRRLAAFVQPYAVLSLGPMASTRAAQMMLEVPATHGLSALDALTVATALAHEIPLVARDARHFEDIGDLHVVTVS